MTKHGVVEGKFGRKRLTSRPLVDKPLFVGYSRPTFLKRMGSGILAFGTGVRSVMSVMLPIIIVGGLAGHDLILAGAYTLAGCRIKGNVSHTSGKRIFHTPGQSYYAETKVTFFRGERWFCSEADARAAGWRRAGM